jgi:hypothetical protein
MLTVGNLSSSFSLEIALETFMCENETVEAWNAAGTPLTDLQLTWQIAGGDDSTELAIYSYGILRQLVGTSMDWWAYPVLLFLGFVLSTASPCDGRGAMSFQPIHQRRAANLLASFNIIRWRFLLKPSQHVALCQYTALWAIGGVFAWC